MHHDPSPQVPTFIPDDLLADYADEARRQVATRRSGQTLTLEMPDSPEALDALMAADAAPSASRRRSPVTVLFVLTAALGLLGWAALVGWWGWMAWTTGDMIWGGIAAAGGLVIPVGIVAIVQMARTPELRTPLDARGRSAAG